MQSTPSLRLPAKMALFGLIVGTIVLLGGIPFQIIIGLGRVTPDSQAEKLAYQMMSQGSLALVGGYILVFISGIAFWLLGPYRRRPPRWFLIAFLAFYAWLPLDWYFIACDIRFALAFDRGQPLTHELKRLFDARQAFAPLPLLALLGYLVAIAMAVFQPTLKRKEK
ncbi:MAG: hypothetical protein ACOYYS_21380 [Chloroflexota bacterium]